MLCFYLWNNIIRIAYRVFLLLASMKRDASRYLFDSLLKNRILVVTCSHVLVFIVWDQKLSEKHIFSKLPLSSYRRTISEIEARIGGIHYVQKIEEWLIQVTGCLRINLKLGVFWKAPWNLGFWRVHQLIRRVGIWACEALICSCSSENGAGRIYSTSRLTGQAQRACHKFNTAAQEA